MPVTNVPQQAGLEGVGSGYNPTPLLFPNNGLSPAREDGDAEVLLAREDAAAVEVLLAREEGDGAAGAAGVAPARGDGDAGIAPPAGGAAAPPAGEGAAPPVGGEAAPAEAIVPQEKVEQIARETVAFAHEDDIVPKNVWVSGTIGITKYNGKCLLSSYTGRTSAATIGGDLELPNGSIIGGAYNYVLSNFEYKNSTEKFTAHTHVIFMYGQTNLSKKLILQGFLSLASGNVSAKLPVQNQLAKAKFANSSSRLPQFLIRHKLGRLIVLGFLKFRHNNGLNV